MLELHLKKDGKLLAIYEPELFKNYYQIDSLKPGNYDIEFNTIFKLIESESINIGDNKIDTLKLCIDKINYESIKYIPFIDRIGVNESFEMKISSQGCFHSAKSTVTVSKTKNKVVLQVDDKTKVLTDEELDYFRKFELELIHMDNYGCTSIDYYTLKYNDQILEIADGSCYWYGYGRLYNLLFNEDS